MMKPSTKLTAKKIPRLKKTLSLRDLVFYGVGVILGAGIYALIGKGALLAGNSLWLSFTLGAIIACFTAFSFAELSSMMPDASGTYMYIKRAFDSKILSFITIWLLGIVGAATAATVALGFSGYFNSILGWTNTILIQGPFFEITTITLISLALIALFGYMIYKSMKESSKLNIIFTTIELSGLILIILLGLLFITQGNPVPNLVEMPNGFGGVVGAMALIFFAYLGFQEIVYMAEDTNDPEKNIPKAIMWSIGITTVVYILVAIAAVTVVPWDKLGVTDAPLIDVATAVMGEGAGLILGLIALFATANTVLIILMTTSRIVYGVSKQGAFPKFLRSISEKTGTPHYAIIATMIISGGFTIMNDIAAVAELANFGLFLVFLLINIALIKIRYENAGIAPFRSPFNIGKFPVLAGLGGLACFATILTYFVNFTETGIAFKLDISVIVSLAILATGVVVYFLLNRK